MRAKLFSILSISQYCLLLIPAPPSRCFPPVFSPLFPITIFSLSSTSHPSLSSCPSSIITPLLRNWTETIHISRAPQSASRPSETSSRWKVIAARSAACTRRCARSPSRPSSSSSCRSTSARTTRTPATCSPWSVSRRPFSTAAPSLSSTDREEFLCHA